MKIHSSEYVLSAARIDQYPEELKTEFLTCGRSNVGKSSFINSLFNRKNLAYISSKPGKTQTLNFYLINDEFYLVDVPGYGYAKVSKKKREEFGQMIELYLTSRKKMKMVFLLVDFRHRPSEDDILMYDYLKFHEINVCVIATKVDKIGVTKRKKHVKEIKEALKFSEEDKMVLYSSETLLGREEVLKLIEKTK